MAGILVELQTMGATKKFIWEKVGAQSKNNAADVKAVKQLLMAAGQTIKGGDTGKWDENSAAALELFQKRIQDEYPNLIATVPIRPYIEPSDHVLLMMAWKGEMLIPLPRKRGWNGVSELHDWFVKNEIKYNSGAEKGGGNRAVFGVDKRWDYAIQTTNMKFTRGPVQMDCTTYVNLMLSIYLFGDAHNAQYNADCSKFGDISAVHCARDRYGYLLVKRQEKHGKGQRDLGYFTNAEQIVEATQGDSSRLYVLEVASESDIKGKDKKGQEITIVHNWGVTHMALLYNGTVYHCTTHQPSSACIDKPINEFMKHRRRVYLFEPPRS